MDIHVGSSRKRRISALLPLTVGSALALVAAACGGSALATRPLTPRQAVLASVTTTESSASAALNLSVSVNGVLSLGGTTGGSAAGRQISLDITGHGLFSFANRVGNLTLDVPLLGQGSVGTVQIEQVGGEIYVSTPRLTAVDGGKQWVSFSLPDFQQDVGSSDPLISLADGNPSGTLGLLKDLSGTVSQVGKADIDGVPTTEYQAELDLAHPTTSSTIISSSLAQILGLTSVPVDVWVDSAGRARQLSTTFSVLGLTVTAQLDLTDFGTPVSVTAPAADQVVPGSTLLQGGQLGQVFGSVLP